MPIKLTIYKMKNTITKKLPGILYPNLRTTEIDIVDRLIEYINQKLSE